MPDGANHVAFAYSADGKDRFMTVYPNLNLIDGTKDFSGDWKNSSYWKSDGTYKGLTVKKMTIKWFGIHKIFTVPKSKTFTAPKDGVYTFSADVKSSGSSANINRVTEVNGKGNYLVPDKLIGNNFDWLRDSVTVTLKEGDNASVRYEISGDGKDSILWTAGHKWEEGSTATPWMPSASEITASDYPIYIGTYTDNNSNEQSTDPEKYSWKKIE